VTGNYQATVQEQRLTQMILQKDLIALLRSMPCCRQGSQVPLILMILALLSATQKPSRNPKLDSIAVKGKRACFEKVIKLIDDFSAECKREDGRGIQDGVLRGSVQAG